MTAIIYQASTPLVVAKPVALTIGAFDGIHRGHRAVLERIAQEAVRRGTLSAVVTYTNHPSEVLRPSSSTPLLCTLPHKIKLLQAAIPLSYLLLYRFDEEFARQGAEEFLAQLMERLPFSYLNMGHDGRLGRGREGDRMLLEKLSQQMNFDLEYMPPKSGADGEISSTRLRQLIQHGELKNAEELLGRPYSILGTVIAGTGRGKSILEIPTANIPVAGLVLPPFGVYSVEAHFQGHQHNGIANLGAAPTLNTDRIPLLEVHIPGFNGDLYGVELEVVFKTFLRPEQRFASVEELREQLYRDIQSR